MSLNGAEISYISGQKNNWRRWAWNRIAEKLPAGVRPKDARVLYLAGKDDLDWPEARRRGFKRENMIACEVDTAVVRHLRKQLVTVIPFRLSQAMMAWPDSSPIHVVHADLCCGLGEEVNWILQSLFARPFLGAAVCLNLQRGRDARKHEVVETARRSGAFAHMPGHHLQTAEKHRGALAAIEYSTMLGARLAESGRSRNEVLPHARAAFGQSASVFSYKQAHSAVYMDSVVFRSVFSCTRFEAQTKAGTRMRRKVAAALAVQTMRRTGQLKSA